MIQFYYCPFILSTKLFCCVCGVLWCSTWTFISAIVGL